jgi:Family of unknown function (DUF6404)
MTFHERRDRALDLMAQTEVAPSRYAPAFYRWLWRLGLQIPPPHFAGAWPTEVNLVTMLLAFSAQREAYHNPLGGGLMAVVAAAVMVRLVIARRYAREAERLDLPAWHELGQVVERRRPGSILGLGEDHREDRR